MDLNKERLLYKYKNAVNAFATLQTAERLIKFPSEPIAKCAHEDPETIHLLMRDSF